MISALCGMMLFPASQSLAQARFEPDAEIQKVGDVAFQSPKRTVLGCRTRGNKPLRRL